MYLPQVEIPPIKREHLRDKVEVGERRKVCLSTYRGLSNDYFAIFLSHHSIHPIVPTEPSVLFPL